MRLAFAVAAHLKHEILLIDEVLAVGDASFQKKCLGKINLEAGSGRTVLFVSHNMSAILSLCNRALYLEKGRLIQDGKTSEVVETYLGRITKLCSEKTWPTLEQAPGNHIIRIHSVRVLNSEGESSIRFENSKDIVIEICYWNILFNSKIGCTIAIYNSVGMCVFGSIGNHEPNWHKKSRLLGLYRSICRIPPDLMKDGVYQVVVLFWSEGYTDMYRLDTAIEFEVIDSGILRGDYFGGWEGVILPRLEWTCEFIEKS
jgi:lipopolysaccharide transport system ATP-binding protein